MPGGGDFVLFFSTQWPEFCTEKLSPGRVLTKNIIGQGVNLGGDSNQSN